MEIYEADALAMAGIYVCRVTLQNNKKRWVVYVNGISRGYFDNRNDAETSAIELAYDKLTE